MGLFSCSEEDVISNLSQNKNAIGFSIALDNAQEESRTFSAPIGIKKNMVLRSADSADTLAMDVLELKGVETQLQDRTRGVAVSESNLTSFEVYASKKEKSTSSISSYFKNLRVNRNASTGDCNSVEQHYWPGSIYTLDFISLAPFSPSGLTVNMDNNGIMPISFDYVVPSKATDQTDILVATKNNVAGDFLNDVRLEFQHICSAINVKVGSIPQGVIKSVKFKNVYGEAQYSVQTSN